MNRPLSLALGLVLAASACLPRNSARDAEEIWQRYPHIYKESECNSWLRSHKSGQLYCASPAFTVAVEAPKQAAPKIDTTKVDKDSLMARGEVVYGQVCAACHQANGQGVPNAFPPLAGAGEYYGTPQNHARIIVHGLQGEIVVLGNKYNGAMPPQGSLSDYDIASVATFVRHSWGNNDGIVLPDDVKAVR